MPIIDLGFSKPTTTLPYFLPQTPPVSPSSHIRRRMPRVDRSRDEELDNSKFRALRRAGARVLILSAVALSILAYTGFLFTFGPPSASADGAAAHHHNHAHDHGGQRLLQQDADVNASPEAVSRKQELKHKWNFEWSYSGISTFAHLDHVKCLVEPDVKFDIGIIGAPFDTAVSYRTGARFGPRAIRAASARQSKGRGWNPRAHLNPYKSALSVIDCGDIPLLPLDNGIAVKQMTEAMLELGSRATAFGSGPDGASAASFPKPKLLTLGGDHSVALGALRALRAIHGRPITVLHFDAHLDTWIPPDADSGWPWFSEQARFNHGDVFALAWEEGLIANGSSCHVGLRTRLSGPQDLADDARQGFMQIAADAIDDIGTEGIVDLVKKRVGDNPVYLSFDIDVVDPGLAPGTGTPEVGGFTSREVVKLLRGLEDLNVVGADIVEVAPAYDGQGEQTALVAAQVAYEILTNWVAKSGL